ncbi:hypothetical protein DYB32_005498 [Aphanomyces invadans]|uniref:Uncharacterized protein n=1 Tax=Aphanomyces invadans TaxID=157072 RepID=A0A418AUC9_9STRA|nr:hypothetical protein DYB32_005498 [Aphanomyces invadans]
MADNAETEDDNEEVMVHSVISSKKRPLEESHGASRAEGPVNTAPPPDVTLAAHAPPQMPNDDQYKIPKKKRDVVVDNVPIPKRKRQDMPRRTDPRRPTTSSHDRTRPAAAPSNPFERLGSNSSIFSQGYENSAANKKADKNTIIFQPGDKGQSPHPRHKHPTATAGAKAVPSIDPSVPRRVSFHSEWIQPASTNLRRVVEPVPILKMPDDSSRKPAAGSRTNGDRPAETGGRSTERPADTDRNQGRGGASKNQTISMTEYKKARQAATVEDDKDAANKVKERPTDPRRAMKRPDAATTAALPPPPPTQSPQALSHVSAQPSAVGNSTSSLPPSKATPRPLPPTDPRKKQPVPAPLASSATPSPTNVPSNRPHDPRARPPVGAILPTPVDTPRATDLPPSAEPAHSSPRQDVNMDEADDDNSWMLETPPSKYATGASSAAASALPSDKYDIDMSGVHDAGDSYGDDEDSDDGHSDVRSTRNGPEPSLHPLEGEYIEEEYGEDEVDQERPPLAVLKLAPDDLYNVVWLLYGRVHTALVSTKPPLTKKADSHAHLMSLVRDVEAIRDAPIRVTFDIRDRMRGHDSRTEVSVRVGSHLIMHYLDKGSEYTALRSVLPALYMQCWVWNMIVNNVQAGLYNTLDQVLKKSRYYEFNADEGEDEGSRVLDDGSVCYFKCIFRLQLGHGTHESDVEIAKTRCYDSAWTLLQAMCSRISFMYRPLEDGRDDKGVGPDRPNGDNAAAANMTSSMAQMKVDGGVNYIPVAPASTTNETRLAHKERDDDSPGSSPIYAPPIVLGRLPDQFSDDDDDIYA